MRNAFELPSQLYTPGKRENQMTPINHRNGHEATVRKVNRIQTRVVTRAALVGHR